MPMESKSTPSTKPTTKKTCAIKRCRIYRWLRLMSTKENLYGYIQRRWRLLSILVLYVFFRPVFEGKLASLLESFESSWGSFIIWLILIYSLMTPTFHHNTPLRRKIHPLCKRCPKTLVIILLGGWFYYRFIGASDYIPTSTPIPWICYIDIFLVICISLSITKHKSYKEEKKELHSIKENYRKSCTEGKQNGYLIDQPIVAKDEDLLGRRDKANALADRIFHTNTSETAFTLGLTAPWGAGKTSFMLAMEEHLKEQHGTTIILWKFNPWLHRKAPNLTQVFFEELSNRLSPYNSDLASNFTHYVNSILAKEDNMWVQLSTLLLPQSFKAKSVGEQYESLKQEIRQLRRKIFVFIDDVDRLDSEELTELFCLVRNISSFPNMSYILAYDKEYVTNQLKNKFNKDTNRYMVKILQEEYPLAKITPEQLEDALMDVLEKLSQGYPHLKEDIQKSGIQLEQHLPTLRTIKRIYNALLSTPQDLRERIAHFDWFVIELIRMQYPLLFDFLKTKYTQAFLVGGDRRVVMKLEGEERNALLSEDTIEEEVVDFTQYLYKNQEGLGIENPNHILELMKKIWGKDRSNVIPQVNDWECIGRYFYRTMREGEFDIAQLHQYLSLPFTDGQQHPMKKIIPYVDGIHKSSYWKRFCSIIHEIDLKQEQTVNMLYLYFYILSLEKVQPLFSPECDKWITSLREQEGEKREREILENLFSYPDIQKGVLLYISSILNRAEEVRIPFSSDELEAIKKKLFLEYTPDNTSIDPIDCYRLWHICQILHRVKIGDAFFWQINPEKSSFRINERMRDIIVKNIEQLIPYFIQEPMVGALNGNKGNMYRLLLPYPIWTLSREEVTEKIAYFPKFISELDTSSSIIKEFHEFFEKWFEYIQILKGYLMNPEEQASDSHLSQMDRYWIMEMQQKDPRYLQHLKNNPQEFFLLLRCRHLDELGFIRFTFKSITPQDIMTDNLEESSSIEL